MGAALFIAFVVLVLCGIPLALCLSGAALVAFAGWSSFPTTIVIQKFFTGSDSFTLLAIPFFMMSGSIMSRGGVSKRLVDLISLPLKNVPGGLAMVTIVACAFFGAISGSAPATCAAIGGIMIPAMIQHKYDDAFAMTTSASGGFLGHIIPPSISMVTFSVVAGCSISDMFLAGFLPGILLALCMCIYAFLVGKRHNYIIHSADDVKLSGRQIFKIILEAIPAILMPVIILGGIYGGIFTPTEAGCISVVYGLLVSLFIYKEMTIKDLPKILVESALSTSMVVLIISGASSFANVLTREMIPNQVATFITGISSSKYVFLLLVNILLLIVGCFMDTQVAIVIIAPILVPVAQSLGVDIVHFGIIMICNLAIGLITPPLGMNLNVASGIGHVPLTYLLKRYLFGYLVADIIALLLITYIPILSLLLPGLK